MHAPGCACEQCFPQGLEAVEHMADNPSDSITLTRAQLGRQLDKAYAEGQRRGEEAVVDTPTSNR